MPRSGFSESRMHPDSICTTNSPITTTRMQRKLLAFGAGARVRNSSNMSLTFNATGLPRTGAGASTRRMFPQPPLGLRACYQPARARPLNKRTGSRRRLISKRAKLAERWLRVTYRALIGKDFQARPRVGSAFYDEFIETEPVTRALRRHSGLRSRARREIPVENLRARPVQHALEASRMIVDRFQVFD